MNKESRRDRPFPGSDVSGDRELSQSMAEGRASSGPEYPLRQRFDGVARIACFFTVIFVGILGLDRTITFGLRHVKTGQYGVSNRIMQGKVNAQLVITGSSRALSHYDPRILETKTGLSGFNLGRNGSQTDMQLALFRTYLEHNKNLRVVLHNLDGFSFEATRQVYDPGQYVPYLYDRQLYDPLRRINPAVWKSRYLPLYGYVVEDMSFSWMLGLAALVGWSPREEYFLGFNPRSKAWTDEFQNFKAGNSNGISWPIDPEGVQGIQEIIHLCRQEGFQLIFVYSPEYSEMQKLTRNRSEVFARLREMADRADIPFWDYSDWRFAGETRYFQNSQHLNADGAELFSADLGDRLKAYLALSHPAR